MLKVTKNHLAENCDILTSLGRIWGVCACPEIGVSYFQKTSTPVFGHARVVPFFKLGMGMGAEIRRDDGFLYENQKIESGLKMI